MSVTSAPYTAHKNLFALERFSTQDSGFVGVCVSCDKLHRYELRRYQWRMVDIYHLSISTIIVLVIVQMLSPSPSPPPPSSLSFSFMCIGFDFVNCSIVQHFHASCVILLLLCSCHCYCCSHFKFKMIFTFSFSFSFIQTMIMRRIFVAAILIGSCCCVVPTQYGVAPMKHPEEKPTEPCVEWTGATFEWPCAQTKSLYKSSGKYISKNVIATRAQIIGDHVYTALPRYKSGVPATLARTQFKKGTCAAKLSPFPCWSMQEEGNCESLQSVVDIVADRNNILWALDVGVVNTLETPVRKCPPKVIAISTKTGKVLKTISLEKLVAPTSRLQYLTVDYKSENRCFIYVSDAAQRSILVYDVQASRGFRVVLPQAVTNGCPKRDVLYLALANRVNGTSSLYFSYLSSKHLFVISTEYLRSGNIQGRINGKLLTFSFYYATHSNTLTYTAWLLWLVVVAVACFYST